MSVLIVTSLEVFSPFSGCRIVKIIATKWAKSSDKSPKMGHASAGQYLSNGYEWLEI